jgi:hypothetical protein
MDDQTPVDRPGLLERYWPMLRTYAISTPILLVVGAWLNQPTPKEFSLSVDNPNFAAGETINIHRHLGRLPDNCSPSPTRWIAYDNGHSTILGDMKAPPVDDLSVPTPSRLRLGCGWYHESLSAACGWFSGIFPPAGGKSIPVRVCVLPPLPVK